MPDLNKVFLAGRLTRDPELRYLPNGTPLCKMGLAVSRFFKNKDGERQEDTFFINVTTWSKSAEFCNEYLKKGRPVLVEGQLRGYEYQDKEGQKRTGMEVNAVRVQQLDWADRPGGGGGAGGGGAPAARPEPRPIEEPLPTEDDIPF
jgi:single-strand DNA-binding protein